MKILFILLTLTTIVSCAKTDEALLDSSKREALYHLTHGRCSKAKTALDEVDYQNSDSEYIRLYSDVYACKAGYSQLSTVVDNLGSLTATSADLFTTLASMPASQLETEADSTAYTNLMLAINTLVYSNGSTPSAASRITKFGSREAGDMDYQALFLILIEMGKYFGYYGNVAADGTKGGGAGTEECLAQLTDATAGGYLDTFNGGDSCDNADMGDNTKSGIKSGDTDYLKKLCEGVVLFNNFQDILANITFSSNSSELGDLVNVGAVLNTIESTAAAVPGVGTAITDYQDMTSQSACEALAVTNGNELQRYFGLIIENLHN